MSSRYTRLKKVMRRVIEVLHCDIDCAGYFAFFNDRTDYETLDQHFALKSYVLTKPTKQRFERSSAVEEPPGDIDVDESPSVIDHADTRIDETTRAYTADMSASDLVDGRPSVTYHADTRMDEVGVTDQDEPDVTDHADTRMDESGVTNHADTRIDCDTRVSTADTSAVDPPPKRARLSQSDDEPVVSSVVLPMPPPVAGARSWRVGKLDNETMRETMLILGLNWHKGGLRRAMVSPEYLGSKLLEKSQSQFKNYDLVAEDTDTKGYTYKIYCNGERYGNKFISYIFKGSSRVDSDWAIAFVVCREILIFQRLCILNRELTNMYLDFLHKTFCRQRHDIVSSKVTMFKLNLPEGRQDKAQTLIAQSVGFKKDAILDYYLKV